MKLVIWKMKDEAWIMNYEAWKMKHETCYMKIETLKRSKKCETLRLILYQIKSFKFLTIYVSWNIKQNQN